MRAPFVSLIVVALVAVAPLSRAARVSGDALVRADAARMEAMVASDYSTLQQVLADDLTYVHSTGRMQSKSELIASMRSGEVHYQSITTDGVKARVYGSTAVITGGAKMVVGSAAKPAAFSLRYTAMYVNQAGHWRLVAYQSTAIPAP
jgi:ketosteroid isomerase-like protein